MTTPAPFRSTLLLLASSLWCLLVAAADAPAPSYFHKQFAGQIGGKYAVTFDLKNLDGELTGIYRYEGKKQGLYLRGKIDPSGSFVMDELAGGSKVTGTFTGKFTAGRAEGTWRSADGRRTLPFAMDQTSEVRIGTKTEILQAAVGTYPLVTISGSGGANGMWDTWKDGGRWSSNASGISAGRREGRLIPLKKADLALLDSLRIVVGADLAVTLSARGKDLLTIPFHADGMSYELGPGHNEVAVERLRKFSARTTVHDENLYLLVRDRVDYSKAMTGSFESRAEGILVVSYSVVDRSFALEFIEGQCCDTTTWTFGRRKP